MPVSRDARSPPSRTADCAAFLFSTAAPDRLHATAQAACQTSRPPHPRRLRSAGRAQTGQAQPARPRRRRARRRRRCSTCSTSRRATPRRAAARRRPAPPRRRCAAPPPGARSRAAQAARHRAGQALRARHQRADARPDVPVPLRGARHLPADDHARGARRPQEGHERGGAQRAPGQPRPRRAGRQHAQRAMPPAWPTACRWPHRPPRGRRQAVLPDHAGRRQPAGRPAAGQGRQPDPGRGAGAARAAARARGGAGVQGHQHAHQGARAGPAGRGLLQRQDARRRRPALHRRAAAAGRLLGAPRQDHGELAAGRPHLLPHQRPAGAGAADQPVRLPRGAGRRAAVRQGHRDHRQDRGAADAARLHPREERGLGRDGAQPRAELRAQPADGPGVRLHHADRHRRHRQDADDAGRRPDARCWTTAATPRSSSPA